MEREYNTGLCKGQGMLPETLRLLQVWEPGMSSQQLAEKVRSQGLIPKATAQRVSDIVNRMFVPRYLCPNGQPAGWLRQPRPKGRRGRPPEPTVSDLHRQGAPDSVRFHSRGLLAAVFRRRPILVPGGFGEFHQDGSGDWPYQDAVDGRQQHPHRPIYPVRSLRFQNGRAAEGRSPAHPPFQRFAGNDHLPGA